MPRRKPRRRSPGDPPAAPERPAIPTLDLHGETAEAALRRTRAWLESQRGPGSRSVRVVTGRGAHSAGPPVLRGEVAG
ncbi:MAG: Smr/MutS family protein, partial [Gemmatimonadota bacterium]|nr:Smr/MutS family protein [Gemmatimonadota bacterium]